MSFKSLASEKEWLLPVSSSQLVVKAEPCKESKLETALFYTCIATLLLLFACIYYKNSIPILRPFASTLSAGMLPSLWASLPAPALLFICAPYFAEPSKVTTVRYWIYLLYIIGVVAGALVFGNEADALQRAMS
jgi:hypothetical protein